MKKSRTTIKDVAKMANVTPQTVSRAIRGTPNVAEETKARILKIAAQLNYCKNSTASALRRGATHSIAIVYDELKNVYYSIIIDFLQSCLEKRGYSILTFSYRYSYLTKETYLKAISHNVDGIISFLDPKEEIEELIEGYQVPVLLLGRSTTLRNVDCVFADDITGGFLVGQKFIEKGCKNPLYITFPDDIDCNKKRLLGFQNCFKENGINNVSVFYKDDEFESKLKLLLSGENRPDCIFCFNDMLAFEVINIINKNNQIIPVVGYDNIQQEIYLPYRLTTIGVDKFAMAEHGVEILFLRMSGNKGEYVRKIEQVYLVQGQSA